jgi:hypothetical protein
MTPFSSFPTILHRENSLESFLKQIFGFGYF